jgi:hypothetical protein
MKEPAVELHLRKEIERLGGVCRKWVSPGHVGVPDRICFLPGAMVVFVEVKTDTGKLSVRQEREIATLRALNADVKVVYGIEGVDCLIRELEYALTA